VEEITLENPLAISLAVSGIGILMLFVTLAVLYLLIYLMTALIKDRAEPGAWAEDNGLPDSAGSGAGAAARSKRAKHLAAAAAVALARAELDLAAGASQARGQATRASAWRALHHQRRLGRNHRARRLR
jgi:Na+-transporting methylmalonyl-CoA/oxaloacetate decarboxylase gamma subunit